MYFFTRVVTLAQNLDYLKYDLMQNDQGPVVKDVKLQNISKNAKFVYKNLGESCTFLILENIRFLATFKRNIFYNRPQVTFDTPCM